MCITKAVVEGKRAENKSAQEYSPSTSAPAMGSNKPATQHKDKKREKIRCVLSRLAGGQRSLAPRHAGTQRVHQPRSLPLPSTACILVLACEYRLALGLCPFSVRPISRLDTRAEL